MGKTCFEHLQDIPLEKRVTQIFYKKFYDTKQAYTRTRMGLRQGACIGIDAQHETFLLPKSKYWCLKRNANHKICITSLFCVILAECEQVGTYTIGLHWVYDIGFMLFVLFFVCVAASGGLGLRSDKHN